jgi:hypothetical protein
MIIKNQRVILEAGGTGIGPTIETFFSFQKFVGKLLAGGSASVRIEMSSDGETDWTEVCTFALDTPLQEIDTDLVRVPRTYVRANVLTLTGNTPHIIVHMGA